MAELLKKVLLIKEFGLNNEAVERPLFYLAGTLGDFVVSN